MYGTGFYNAYSRLAGRLQSSTQRKKTARTAFVTLFACAVLLCICHRVRKNILAFNSAARSSTATSAARPCGLKVENGCGNCTPTEMMSFNFEELSPNERGRLSSGTEFGIPAPHAYTTIVDGQVFDPSSDNAQSLRGGATVSVPEVHQAMLQAQTAIRLRRNRSDLVITRLQRVYTRLSQVHGLQYVVHVTASESPDSAGAPYSVCVQHLLDGTCRTGVAGAGRVTPVYVVVPYAQRPRRLRLFLRRLSELRARGEDVLFVMALHARDARAASAAERAVRAAGIPRRSARVVHVTGDVDGRFSRAVAVRAAVRRVPARGLMLIVDVDVDIQARALAACRRNALRGRQAYLPVLYSLFPGAGRIRRGNGFWRVWAYGTACLYKSDFIAAAGAAYVDAESRFRGWGREDIVLAQALAARPRFYVFRAVEPGLTHRWHVKHCEQGTRFYRDCLNTVDEQLGTASSLGKMILRDKGIDTQDMMSVAADFDP